MLGDDLRVRTQTERAASALLQLLPPDEPMEPEPAAAYNAGAALIAFEEGMPIGGPWSRVHLGGSRWVTVEASRLGADIAVSIEPSTPAERTDLSARADGLSAREAEVLGMLAIGLDSRAIAEPLISRWPKGGGHGVAAPSHPWAGYRGATIAHVDGRPRALLGDEALQVLDRARVPSVKCTRAARWVAPPSMRCAAPHSCPG